MHFAQELQARCPDGGHCIFPSICEVLRLYKFTGFLSVASSSQLAGW